MVHNLNQILDESEIKNVDEIIMPEKIDYRKLCYQKNLRLKWVRNQWDSDEEEYLDYQTENEKWKPMPPKINWWFKEWNIFLESAHNKMMNSKEINEIEENSWKEFESREMETILDYLDIIPFIPCMMFNISPNWKGLYGKNKLTDELMEKKFCKVIDTYLNNCNRYSSYKYCLESGSEDNFLHAHVVAEINPKMINSVLNGKNSHVRKGNHVQEIRKIWDKVMPKGYVGYLKGKFSIQSIILRNEILKEDKLKYLVEENKPEGHKNKRDLHLLFGVL